MPVPTKQSLSASGVNLTPDLTWKDPDIFCPKMGGPKYRNNYWSDSCMIRRKAGCLCAERAPKCSCGKPVSAVWEEIGASRPMCHRCARLEVARIKKAKATLKESRAEAKRLNAEKRRIERRLKVLARRISAAEEVING